MKSTEFTEILERRLKLIEKTLGKKAEEYVQGDDRLYNFKRAAEIARETPAKSLWGMGKKHLVSVIDLVENSDMAIEDLDSYHALIDEKIGDMINYLILLEAILKDPPGLDRNRILEEDPPVCVTPSESGWRDWYEFSKRTWHEGRI